MTIQGHTLVPETRRRAVTMRLVLLVTGLAAVAFTSVVLNARGYYIGEFRFEVGWRPARTLTHLPQLWDGTGGLGRVAGADRSPVPAMLFALLRSLGLEAWAAQRVWHGFLLLTAGTGCVAVVRYFEPRVGLWHLMSGLAYMFSPLGLGLLLPSPIYATYAVAPWLFAATLHGTARDRPWRWAAIFALGVFATVPVELPGTIYVVALASLAVPYVVHIERRATYRDAFLWLLKAALLTGATTSWVVIRTALGDDSLLTRLQITETPEVVATTSSWSEGFRGLGHWLTYFRFLGSDLRPNFAPFVENPAVIIATLAIPLVGIAMLCFRPSRMPSFFVVISAVSLLVLVGLHPVDEPSPWGKLLGWFYEHLPATEAFRTTMKAGAGHALATAVLFGAASERAWRSWPSRPTRLLVATAALGLVALASTPVWTGDLYAAQERMDRVPDYWLEAIDWLDDQPGNGRVLLLPGTAASVYRWGKPGDDLFEALLDRPHVQPSVLAITSTPTAESLTSALDARLRSLHLPDQSLAPTLQRLGIQYLVVRNDLEWFQSNLPRPAQLTPIREDPNFRLVQTSGTPGLNTTGPDDQSALGLAQRASAAGQALQSYESALPPVEVYEVNGVVGTARVSRPQGDLLVAGDGHAVFELTSLGLLEGHAPLRYIADLDDRELVASLRSGARPVITDSNIRRRLSATGTSYNTTAALAVGDVRDDVGSLFERADSQTVAWIADAVSIGALDGYDRDAWYRAEQAFDGDPRSSWRIAPFASPVGQGILVTLRRPEAIGEISLLIAQAPERQVRGGYVELDDGTRLPFTVGEDAEASVDGRGQLSETVRIEIDDADEEGLQRVGIAEIQIDGLDLRPARQAPIDLFTRAEQDTDLAAALADRPLALAFEREHQAGSPATEMNLRRRFLLDGPRSFRLRGRVRPTAGVGIVESPDCQDLVLMDDLRLPVRLVTPSDPTSETREIESCDEIELGAGWHSIEGASGTQVDRLELIENDPKGLDDAGPEPQGHVIDSGPSSLTVDVDTGPAGAIVVSGIAYDDGWTATIDGSHADSVQLDGQVAVRIADQGHHRVVFDYAPQRIYAAAVLVSMLSVPACFAVALSRPPRSSEAEDVA